MLSEPLIYTITGIVVLCILGIVLRRDPRRDDADEFLGVTKRDLRDYAGQVVAYDCETNEMLWANDDIDEMVGHLRMAFPWRQFHLVRLPSERGGPIQLLGHFGPYETHSESEDR
jgi:hypothetical protein